MSGQLQGAGTHCECGCQQREGGEDPEEVDVNVWISARAEHHDLRQEHPQHGATADTDPPQLAAQYGLPAEQMMGPQKEERQHRNTHPQKEGVQCGVWLAGQMHHHVQRVTLVFLSLSLLSRTAS